MNCTDVLVNNINSNLFLLSARFVEKVVLDRSPSASSYGDSLSICVDRFRI